MPDRMSAQMQKSEATFREDYERVESSYRKQIDELKTALDHNKSGYRDYVGSHERSELSFRAQVQELEDAIEHNKSAYAADLAEYERIVASNRAQVEELEDTLQHNKSAYRADVARLKQSHIEHLNALSADFRAKVEEEQAARHRAEEILQDFKRECREPFIVPALLDMFQDISKLTSIAMEEEEGMIVEK